MTNPTQTIDWKAVQQRLRQLDLYTGAIDGIPGPKTEAAIIAFKTHNGLRARPYLGPITLGFLFERQVNLDADLPWMVEASKHIGLHEARDFGLLSKWLRSDGAALGDPRKFPWCGDFVATCLRLTLPDEPFPGPLGINPYLARNWMHLGENCGPRFGAVVVFWRGNRNGISGHVGFAVAIDSSRRRIKVRGGNQRNSVSDAWLDSERILGYRRPVTFNGDLPLLPGHTSAGATVSRNEA